MSENPSELVERDDGFNYDYRMWCDACGQASVVTAAVYASEVATAARAQCNHCPAKIHFGPAVARIRDEADPVLDDAAAQRFAWYHTSTWPNWPSTDHAAERTEALSSLQFDFIDMDRVIYKATHQALHLGTYEAAIENMLRRIRYQSGGPEQFYLYRVALRLASGGIEPGYRDENDEVAATITVGEFGLYDAIRYLNVHEATGTISLAVKPECVYAVQCLEIPTELPVAQLPADALINLERLDVRLRSLSAEMQLEYYAVWREVQDLLALHDLHGVSPVVVEDFNDAAADRRRDLDIGSVDDFTLCFRPLASLLTSGRDVVKLVSQQPWRLVS